MKDIDSLEIMRLVGNTPLYRLDCETGGAELWIKLEGGNPGGSIKDRAAWGDAAREAQKRGELTERSVIVEPTSGNTGIGLALLGRALGLSVVLTMPESMSVERRARAIGLRREAGADARRRGNGRGRRAGARNPRGQPGRCDARPVFKPRQPACARADDRAGDTRAAARGQKARRLRRVVRHGGEP